ncbi:hypothetical protein FHY55_18930 [Oceanicola sp. D3]|uniref:hypothetical protein n=1 Tax=Oceanicola sp. D3 TaxID=2587163 RepID=UPI001121B349|nr:hypothetical protein [Oceanicola sp. D3]QDC11179.1 hypothetical protein FHY55_18930 [Oceanicola sp. D3]
MRLGRLFAALIALATLAGCEGTELPGFLAGSADTAGAAGAGGAAPASSIPPKPPTRLTVTGVTVAAPEGYCVDTRARKGGFVLLAACSAISQSPEHPAPGRMGLLTATIGKRGSGADPVNPGQLAAYFRSASGRAALSYAGEASSVVITETVERPGLFMVALVDSAAPPSPELGTARWRGFFTVNGRLVSVVLHSLKDDPVGKQAGLGLLQEFVARIRAETAG